ncbi:putative RNA-directed DNA polymerase [Helianthus annuus]|nr:putative RNA-directed DNA polymerase [Helianthus annuus]
MIFKIDFEKAYDSVNWNFLSSNLKAMGFPTLWRKWIDVCLKSRKAPILVNGSPSSVFRLSRGLRQEDPISPFVFIRGGSYGVRGGLPHKARDFKGHRI